MSAGLGARALGSNSDSEPSCCGSEQAPWPPGVHLGSVESGLEDT